MLRNYLKIALKVLLRRKFFTFISLFGIAATLGVLMVSATLLDNGFHPNGAESNSDRCLIVRRASMTFQRNGRAHVIMGTPGHYMLEKYFKTLREPQKVTIFSNLNQVTSYPNDLRLESRLRYADEAYWNVLTFNFIQGRPFSKEDVANGNHYAVISEATATRFFASKEPLGQTLELSGVSYRVIGVVASVPNFFKHASGDIWVPLTTDPSLSRTAQPTGPYQALLMGASTSDLPRIKQEVSDMRTRVQYPDSGFESYIVFADTQLESVARGVFSEERKETTSVGLYVFAIVAMMTLFMLLPALNLVNINVSRIMERRTEIGVRKAFGASSGSLVIQFLIENLLLTFLGGLFGFLLTFVFFKAVDFLSLVPNLELTFSWRIYAYGLTMILIFGLLSGVLPALKMSRLNPVHALKGGYS